MCYTLDMNRVYRIQSKYNKTHGACSPLKIGDNWLEIVDEMINEHTNDTVNHPLPQFDNGIDRHIKHSIEYCGCYSAADLLRWFKGFIPDLLRAGYEIVVLHNVTITAIGEYQVLFKWKD